MYPSASEVIRAGLRLLKDQKAPKPRFLVSSAEGLEEKLFVGIRRLDRGEGIPGDLAVEELRERARARRKPLGQLHRFARGAGRPRRLVFRGLTGGRRAGEGNRDARSRDAPHSTFPPMTVSTVVLPRGFGGDFGVARRHGGAQCIAGTRSKRISLCCPRLRWFRPPAVKTFAGPWQPEAPSRTCEVAGSGAPGMAVTGAAQARRTRIQLRCANVRIRVHPCPSVVLVLDPSATSFVIQGP